MKKAKTSCLLVASLALIFATQGCFGSFSATGRLHTWNREIENRWVGEGAFLLFKVVRVYPLFFLGDALVFNSIVFWGGENPVDAVSPARLQALRDADDARAAEAGGD